MATQDKDKRGLSKLPEGAEVETIDRGKGEEKPAKPKVPMNECGCGCGRKVFKRFAQGHDAKLKSQLLKRVYADINGKAARKDLVKRGWDKFIDESKVAEMDALRKEVS